MNSVAPSGATLAVRAGGAGALPATSSGWALAGAAAVLLVCLVSGSTMLGDPDTQWHIAAGRWMIANGAFPQTDTISHTFAGERWIAKEWLSQVLYAAAHLAGGWHGVVALAAGAVAVAFYFMIAHGCQRNGAAWGLASAAIALSFVAPTLVARPHVLVFPIIAGWTIALLRSVETTRRPPWLALPLLVLWANMHAAFTMGIVIAAAFGLEALLRGERGERPAILVQWAAFGIACICAVIVTPYGYEPLMLNVSLARGNEAMQFIGEWRPMEATARTVLLATIVAACIWALARRPFENAARILLLVLFAYMTVKHQRFAMILGLVAPLLAGDALVSMLADIGRRLDLFQGGRLLSEAARVHLIAGGMAVIGATVAVVHPPGPPATAAPLAALASVPADVRAERVFNSYNLGGFLAHQGIATFIDGRTDQLFLGGFMSGMMHAASSPEPMLLAGLLDRYAIKWAIVGAEQPEAGLFPKLEGWRLQYKDGAAHVYVRSLP